MDAAHSKQLGILLSEREFYLRKISENISGRIAGQEEEIFQIASLELFQAVSSGKHRGRSLSEMASHFWLVINHAIKTLHRKETALKRGSAFSRSGMDLSDCPVSSSCTDPSHNVDIQEQIIEMLSLVDDLPDRQAEAVRLRYLEGCTHREIAELLETSEPAVNGLLKRSMSALRKAANESRSNGRPTDLVAC